MKFSGLVAAAVMAGSLIFAAEPGENIIPRPQKTMPVNTGRIKLAKGRLRIFLTPEAQNTEQAAAARAVLIDTLKKFPAPADDPAAVDVGLYAGLLPHPKIAKLLGGAVPEDIPAQGYVIKFIPGGDNGKLKVAVAGADWRGLAYGFSTFAQMLECGDDGVIYINPVDVVDYPEWPERYMSEDVAVPTDAAAWRKLVAGKISGFAWQYRADWRKFGGDDNQKAQLAAVRKVSELGLLDVMFLIHIYVTPNTEPKFNLTRPEDVQMLIDKCALAAENGVSFIMICADDYTRRVGGEYTFFDEDEAKAFDHSIGKAHGRLMKLLAGALKPRFPELRLAMVGAPYSLHHGIGTSPEMDKYVTDWAAEAPEEVFWVWTGPEICSPVIERKDYLAFKKLLPNHELFVWDNSNMFERPMSRWNTSFYPEMKQDSRGIIYLNDRVFYPGWDWAYAYTLTANDYLWNPAGYDPARSYRAALTNLFGSGAAPLIEAVREKTVPVTAAFELGDRKALENLLPELEKSLVPFRAAGLPDRMIKQVADSAREMVEKVAPELAVNRAAVPVVVDGVPEIDEWSAAEPEYLLPRGGGDDPLPPSVRALYDDKNIYFAFVVPNSGELPELGPQPHDSTVFLNADSVAVFLQPSMGGGYGQWCFDYAGNKFDEPNGEGGFLWNPDWQLAIRRFKDGWTAEMAVPVVELERLAPVQPAPGVRWRANFHRSDR
ncbi:MAG: beta-N-acetylglucosaminidase domain-containing protein, partial [Victivallaceae bacterium]|nr:beta-N-acetylglucosaminidase domain-containing protein [Victivallaceae bacterium]